MAEVVPLIRDVDDGGSLSFDRLVEESRRLVGNNGGTAAEATHWLELRILGAFLNRLRKDSIAAAKLEETTKKNSNIVDGKESNKTNSLGSSDVEQEKRKTGLVIVLKRKRVSGGENDWELERNNEEKKPKKTMSNGGGISQIKKQLKGLEASSKLSSELERRIGEKGGVDIKLVITKQISNTDLNKHHGRLLIPFKQIRKDACFLTKEEESILAKKEKGSNEIGVMLMEPCGVESSMIFVKWSMQKSDNYCLRTSWNRVLERNHDKEKHFKLDDTIQLWSFRVGPQLWFAIDKV